MLPVGGWLVIAFETNNPGAWLMHCHIAWHDGEGPAVQFLQRAREIPSTFDLGGLESEYAAWDNCYAAAYWKEDSGIRRGEVIKTGRREGQGNGAGWRRERNLMSICIPLFMLNRKDYSGTLVWEIKGCFTCP